MSQIESSAESSAKSENNNSQCPICLEALILETLKITKCQHTFCVVCLDKWLTENHTCPMCRTDLNEPDAKNKIDFQHMYTIQWDIQPEDITRYTAISNYTRIDTSADFIRFEFRT